MSTTRLILIGGSKGGGGKTSTSHMGAYGAILSNEAAFYVLTDPLRKVRKEGRPYPVLDGRMPADLAHIITEARNKTFLNAWGFIDGGGNRPEFDKRLAEQVDLSIFPWRSSAEDMDTVIENLQAIPNSVAWPAQWPTNEHARRTAQVLIDTLKTLFPGRVVEPPIDFVNSVNDLLGANFYSKSAPMRTLSKKVFATIRKLCGEEPQAEAESDAAAEKVA